MLDETQTAEFETFLGQYHDVFSLEDGERRETNLTEMVIETGDSPPPKSASTQDASSCASGSGQTTERHAEGRSDPTISKSLVQPCSYGTKEEWDTVLLR